MDIRPLKTEADHEAAIAEIETLMDAEPGSEEFDRLDALSTLVDDYEARVHPIAAPDPVDAILFRLEQAKNTITDQERTLLSAEDREMVLAALDTPAEPTDALRQALALHRNEG